MATQNLWVVVKVVLKGKFIAIQAYLKKKKKKRKKQERHQINNLILQVKQLGKEQQQQQKPRDSRKKEIIKIREETNGKEMKETIATIDKTKVGFLRR